MTEIHRPNGISTYNTYNGRDQIVELINICDDSEWVVSQYPYTYDDRGFIVGETAIESLAGYACDKHANCKYEDCGHDECGRTDGKHGDDCKHKDFYPHGSKHAKHYKDGAFGYRIVETDRTFTYDDAGKLLSVVETIDDCGTFTYTYEYDLMGNRTSEKKVNVCGKVAEWNRYVYSDSNQLVSESSYDGKKVTCIKYLYDTDGNRTTEITKAGCQKDTVNYEYGVENRLEAVYEGGRLLCAMAYDGDGNRVFQLNYNLHIGEEWKCHYGSGCEKDHDGDSCGSDKNGNDKDNCEPENDKDCRESFADCGETSTYCLTGREEKAEVKEDVYRCGTHFPVNAKVSQTERELISKVKNCGKQNYELIEYINDVNREYTEVLVEQNIFSKTDTSYVYGVDRLSLDRYSGCSGYYLYDSRGSVTGITNERGQLYQSYRYDANGGITFGAPQYENEYTYNGESYNPNIESQYLRARYYDVVTAVFYTEDTYLGNIIESLTLNRYNYCVSSPLNYVDPSGNTAIFEGDFITEMEEERAKKEAIREAYPEYNFYQVAVEYAKGQVWELQQEAQAVGDAQVDYYLNDPWGQARLAVYEMLFPQFISSSIAIKEELNGNSEYADKQERARANFYAGVKEQMYFYQHLLIEDDYFSSGLLLMFDSLGPEPYWDTEKEPNAFLEGNYDEFFRSQGRGFTDVLLYVAASSGSKCSTQSLSGSTTGQLPNSPTTKLPITSSGTALVPSNIGSISGSPFLSLPVNVGTLNNESGSSIGGLPDWLKEKFEAGNNFNKENRPHYPYNEVEVYGNKNYVVDSYIPGKEIVSRKHTQLADVKESTGIGYLNELKTKYPSGAIITDSPFNPKILRGQPLRGQLILEIPVQNQPIPQKIIDYANRNNIIIRDVKRKVYNQ